MNAYLALLGFSPTRSSQGARRLYTIANPDGSPRWIWNAENPRPDFLRFYAITGLRARIFSLLVRLVFRLGLQHLVFARRKRYVREDPAHDLRPFLQGDFALFTGTEGPNRKLVLYAQAHFIKIALHESAACMIEREKNTLLALKKSPGVETPQVRPIQAGMLALSDIGKGGSRSPDFTVLHAQALAALQRQFTMQQGAFGDTDIYRRSLQYLESDTGISRAQIPPFLPAKLKTLALSLAHQPLTTAWAHGDFTPWNCWVAKDRLCLYDFEWAQASLPWGFDAFHFVMQQGILVDRLPWQALKPKLRAAFALLEPQQQGQASFAHYLQAYLVVNSAAYLHTYRQQANWHPQISWLLATWNDAASDMLAEAEPPRTLLIGDVFDWLRNEAYAAVKFPPIPPQSLSAHADIDLLMRKPLAKRLLTYLQQHSLAQSLSVLRQSHMLSLLVVLPDGSLLALDLIWQLKRKALTFMRVAEALQDAEWNAHEVKTLNASYTQAYLRAFYGLNHREIPARYRAYAGTEGAGDDHITPARLKQQLAAWPENKGLTALANLAAYGLDVVRRLWGQRGIIITFSGVDGAGKSTVIAHTQREIEKKLRRKVVVIRHRPSLLPILSALTLGKEQAEQKAATTLPRQGQNTSLLSSLLRFVYYYCDYLFGQFYVYARHVWRGEVVLYDRYYFDFILDSERSNIRLPQWLTKAGYRLLIPPALNFFLYADVATILDRKQELDAQTITHLTQNYLSLFRELDLRSQAHYIPIENLDLRQTLAMITAQTQAHLI